MRGDGAAVIEWVGVALSVLLAVALPIVSWRYVRTGHQLRELWQLSRPRAFMAVWIVGIIFIAVSAVLFSVGAWMYPFFWGTVLLHVGGLTASLILVVSYVRFGRRQLAQQIAENAATDEQSRPSPPAPRRPLPPPR